MADSKVSALTNASALGGTEEFHVTQGGADRAAAIDQLRDYLRSTAGYGLAKSAVAVSHTGNTTETTFATITVPAGAMGPNGQIEVQTLWSMTASANNKTIRHKFGGTTFMTSVFAASNLSYRSYARIANRNNAAIQIVNGAPGISGPATTAVATMAIATTAAADIVLTGQLADAGETLTLESYIVKLFPGA